MSGDRTDELTRAWAVLSAPRTEELASFPVGTRIGSFSCRVALDRQGHRHLLVPAADETLLPDGRPSTLEVTVRTLVFAGHPARYVDLRCADDGVAREFDDVILDVLEAVPEAREPGAEALRTIGRWRRLFRSRAVQGLNERTRVGLFAELTVLEAAVDVAPGLDVKVWRGPLRQPHDFEMPNRCLEVKAVGQDTDSIEIHGLDQLDTHDGRPLDLLLVSVRQDPDGATLHELVDRLSVKVSSRVDLASLLLSAGWSANDGGSHEHAYVVEEVLQVPVDEQTPRLVRSRFVQGPPAGIVGVDYRVERAALVAHVGSTWLPEIVEVAVR